MIYLQDQPSRELRREGGMVSRPLRAGSELTFYMEQR